MKKQPLVEVTVVNHKGMDVLCDLSAVTPLVAQQLIDSEVILSVHWVILPLNGLCTLTCILAGHKAQSLLPQLQMNRKPFENVWSSCRVSCFKGCQSSAFSLGN